MENKYKCIGFIPCHYGLEYLEASIKSLDPFVDKIIICYSDQGTQGARTPVPCPETEADLKSLALSSSHKVEWHKAYFYRETDHRNFILQFTDGYDFVISLDTDEVIEPKDMPDALDKAYQSSARFINIKGFVNFWKSFNHVCYDGFLPYRIINLHNSSGIDTVECRIYHMGCCQSEKIIRYKWLVSGHRNEIKPNWIEDTYLAWTPDCGMVDLHCVSRDLWQAVPFDKETLPDVLKLHSNFNKEVVE